MSWGLFGRIVLLIIIFALTLKELRDLWTKKTGQNGDGLTYSPPAVCTPAYRKAGCPASCGIHPGLSEGRVPRLLRGIFLITVLSSFIIHTYK